MKVTTVVRRATRLTRDISDGVVSFIGAKIKAPTNGIRRSPVSIINIVVWPLILKGTE